MLKIDFSSQKSNWFFFSQWSVPLTQNSSLPRRGSFWGNFQLSISHSLFIPPTYRLHPYPFGLHLYLFRLHLNYFDLSHAKGIPSGKGFLRSISVPYTYICIILTYISVPYTYICIILTCISVPYTYICIILTYIFVPCT